MHVEVQVALNFLISFLYNKLPRRRVNQFGEELESTLKAKFEGHWYPDRPYKGSAYRCIRCAPPLDPYVFEAAARNAGMNLADIQENLPQELSIWVDPGEVSYRMSEKGPVKILYSERNQSKDSGAAVAVEPASGLNPEAQCFKPTDHRLSPFQFGSSTPAPAPVVNHPLGGKHHVTFTTATFAATKFGSTKLKTAGGGKKAQRTSPTDFSHYMKQKQHHHQGFPRRSLGPFGHASNGFDLYDSVDDGWKQPNTVTPTTIWTMKQSQMSPRKVPPPPPTINTNTTNNESTNLFESESNGLFSGTESLQFSSNNNNTKILPSENSFLPTPDPSPLSLLSDRLWEDIFSLESGAELGWPNLIQLDAGAAARNEPLYCSSFSSLSSSTMSSPSSSLSSSSNDSCGSISLVNEFDNLSLNSNSSSSIGSVSSYIT